MPRKILAAISTLLLFLAIASAGVGSNIFLWACIVVIGGFDFYLFVVAFKINVCKNRSLMFSGNKILLKESDGETVDSIDVSSSYTLKIHIVLYYPNPLFSLIQNGKKLEFTTQTKNAEFIVKEILKVEGEYPPGLKWKSFF